MNEFLIGEQTGSILLLDNKEQSLLQVENAIAEEIPAAKIWSASSLSSCQERIEEMAFDIVVVGDQLGDQSVVSLIHSLRIRDHEPAILFVASPKEPEAIAAAFNSGCSYCVVRDENWLEKIGPAVRSLLRQRRLEDVNAALIAKLTEANALLEEENSRLDEFARTVAHDIRGPLGGITMRLEYVRDVYRDELDDRFRQLLDSSYCSSRRLIEIVQAMYEFAKLGTKGLKIEEINIMELVNEISADISVPDGIDLEIGVDELPNVWGDPNLLRKVFLNLLNNAVKYSDQQKIIVNIGCAGVIPRSLANFCEISIADNGPGIPSADGEDVFKMFHRGSNVNKQDGTGIGLAVVKRIVELHFGKVRIESTAGQGAKIILSLPLERITLEAT